MFWVTRTSSHQKLNQMNAVAESSIANRRILLTIEACTEIHNPDKMNQQLRQRVEEDPRRHAGEPYTHKKIGSFNTGRESSWVRREPKQTLQYRKWHVNVRG